MALSKALWVWALIHKMDTTSIHYSNCSGAGERTHIGPFPTIWRNKALSPLLFALALEPLAVAICNSPEIVGIQRSTDEDKIALYADDTLLFLGDTSSSLSAVMSLISMAHSQDLLLIGKNQYYYPLTLYLRSFHLRRIKLHSLRHSNIWES